MKVQDYVNEYEKFLYEPFNSSTMVVPIKKYGIGFSSGGIRGVSLWGAYCAFLKYHPNCQIGLTWGTSIGSILALCVALNLNTCRISTVMRDVNLWQEHLRMPDAVDWITMLISKRKGFKSSHHLIQNIRFILIEYCGVLEVDIDMTFEQMYHKYPSIPFACNAVEAISDVEPQIFSYWTTPHVKILDAICASSCIPFLWCPIKINGKLYHDGGIASSIMTNTLYAQGIFEKFKITNTISLVLSCTHKIDQKAIDNCNVKNWAFIILAYEMFCLERSTTLVLNKLSSKNHQIIYIDTQHYNSGMITTWMLNEKPNLYQKIVNWFKNDNLIQKIDTHQQMNELWNDGFKCAKRFFKIK